MEKITANWSVLAPVFATGALVSVAYGIFKTYLVSDEKPEPPFPRVLREANARNDDCQWLNLKKVTYADQNGKVRVWEKVMRRTRPKNVTVDAVMVYAKITGGSRDGCVVFVSQFRPPVGRKTLEFPAGLIDEGETAEEAALRELKEETGLTGKITYVSPPLYLDPGMSESCCNCVYIAVDGTLAENMNPVQTLDQGEFCDVIYVKKPTLAKLKDLSKDFALDANIYMCCLDAH